MVMPGLSTASSPLSAASYTGITSSGAVTDSPTVTASPVSASVSAALPRIMGMATKSTETTSTTQSTMQRIRANNFDFIHSPFR